MILFPILCLEGKRDTFFLEKINSPPECLEGTGRAGDSFIGLLSYPISGGTVYFWRRRSHLGTVC